MPTAGITALFENLPSDCRVWAERNREPCDSVEHVQSPQILRPRYTGYWSLTLCNTPFYR